MKKDNKKQTIKWILSGVGVIVFILIIILIANGLKKPAEVIYNISTIKLAKQQIEHVLTIQGILEGDPQVKVYPQVSGIFVRNSVAEGDSVKKDQVLVYIDRNQVGYKFDLAPVKAPVDGVVTKLYYIDKGDSVSPDNPVAEVANEDSVKVVFNLGQDDLLKVKKGQPAQIFFADDPSVSIQGTVFSVPPVIDASIMAGTVVVTAPNKDKTMEIGMSVNVQITTGETESYMVPESSIMSGEDSSYVYVNRGGKAAKVKVTTGVRKGDLLEISGQLADGDEVVTEGNLQLSDGVKISTTAAAPANTGK